MVKEITATGKPAKRVDPEMKRRADLQKEAKLTLALKTPYGLAKIAAALTNPVSCIAGVKPRDMLETPEYPTVPFFLFGENLFGADNQQMTEVRSF